MQIPIMPQHKRSSPDLSPKGKPPYRIVQNFPGLHEQILLQPDLVEDKRPDDQRDYHHSNLIVHRSLRKRPARSASPFLISPTGLSDKDSRHADPSGHVCAPKAARNGMSVILGWNQGQFPFRRKPADQDHDLIGSRFGILWRHVAQ